MKLPAMNCPVCNQCTFTEWGATGTYAVHRCTQCGLGITFPAPTFAESANVNQEKYQLRSRIQTYDSRKKYFSRRYRRQLRDIRAFKAGGTLLDVGCNIGAFLTEARAAGFQTAGVEMNRECAEYAQSQLGLDVFNGRLDQAGFADGAFDVVTLYDVLEHVPEPTRLLQEIRRILKPTGLLVVQSPNIDSVMANWTKTEWQWLCLPDHLFHFTPATLATLIGQSGFEVQAVRTWEPADVFWDNILQLDLRKRPVQRIARKAIQVSGLAVPLTALLQRIWWSRRKGALVESFAVK